MFSDSFKDREKEIICTICGKKSIPPSSDTSNDQFKGVSGLATIRIDLPEHCKIDTVTFKTCYICYHKMIYFVTNIQKEALRQRNESNTTRSMVFNNNT